MNEVINNISINRLSGEPCPNDVQFLIENCQEMLEDMAVQIVSESPWEPWNDKSYLTEEDLANPDIAANVKAIEDTFKLIDFIAQTDEGEYYGYWRGIDNLPISESPIVFYDNEGQFSLCGSRFIESLFFNVYDDELLDELKVIANNNGLDLSFNDIDEIVIPQTKINPDKYHSDLYYKYLD